MAKFLITCNNMQTSQRLVTALSDRGHAATTAANGWQLLDRLVHDREAFDIVVSDTRIGFPDGLSVATLARAVGVATPFLLCAGLSTERARKVAAGLGNIVLLETPTVFERLLESSLRLLVRQLVPQAPWMGAFSLFTDDDQASKVQSGGLMG